ncbi:hypothetical protein ACX03_02395 [Vibrio parahaemolyticus]|nr:hypothetical protein ACX03_02395 [Vibrio parahaemolyticus]
MRKETEYSIEEIIKAAQQHREFKATGDLSKRISFHTKSHVTLSLEDVPKVQKIIDYIENNYKVKLKIVGGGYGCTKINFQVDGPDSAVELAKKLLSDPEFKKLAGDISIDVLVLPEKLQTLKVNDENNDDLNNLDSKGRRVSADGSVQNTGTGI